MLKGGGQGAVIAERVLKGSALAERGSGFAERVLFWSVCSGKGAYGTCPILRKGFGPFAERGRKGFV